MNIVPINLSGGGYDVQIGFGLQIAETIAPIGKDIVLIHDAVFVDLAAGQHLAEVTSALDTVGRVRSFAVASGEKSKSLETYGRLAEEILASKITRDTVVVALGGGVVGDLAGFLAASLLRGLTFVQIPTTLLAQVDSSVGGKVGINARAGKNLIGAFYQPRAVLADGKYLKTLPEREFAAGMAEVLKAALLADRQFWLWLQLRAADIVSRESEILSQMIARAVKIKADVVAADEKEQLGRRALLNLGHTFAHALERAVDYDGTRLIHGEAVAIGMVMAARLSMQLGMISQDTLLEIEETITKFRLPTKVYDNVLQISARELAQLMLFDKKNTEKGLRLVLLQALGDAVLSPAPPEEHIMAAIAPSLEV